MGFQGQTKGVFQPQKSGIFVSLSFKEIFGGYEGRGRVGGKVFFYDEKGS